MKKTNYITKNFFELKFDNSDRFDIIYGDHTY